MQIPADLRPKLAYLLVSIMALAAAGTACLARGQGDAAHPIWIYLGAGLLIFALFFAVVGSVVLAALRE